MKRNKGIWCALATLLSATLTLSNPGVVTFARDFAPAPAGQEEAYETGTFLSDAEESVGEEAAVSSDAEGSVEEEITTSLEAEEPLGEESAGAGEETAVSPDAEGSVEEEITTSLEAEELLGEESAGEEAAVSSDAEGSVEEEITTSSEAEEPVGEESVGEETAVSFDAEGSMEGEEPASAGEEESMEGEGPASAGEEESVEGDEPASAGEEESVEIEEPASAGEEESVEIEEPASAGEEESVEGEGPVLPGEEESVEIEGPASADGQESIGEILPEGESLDRNQVIDEEPVDSDADGNADVDPEDAVQEERAYFSLEPVKYIEADGTTGTCYEYSLLDENTTEMSDGWYVADGNVEISNNCLLFSGSVRLILCDNARLTVHKGIFPTFAANSLTIYAQSTEDLMGELMIDDVDDGDSGIYGGTITINGGGITSKGGEAGAGIGYYGDTITISGGTVTATGGENGEGIDGREVTISGGTVTATGGEYGAGIGNNYSDTITISGGTVTATGGKNCAGIDGQEVTISGGTVTATGGEYWAGIGGGKVTITGGTVTATGGEEGVGIDADSLTLSLATDNDSLKFSGCRHNCQLTVAEGSAVKYEDDDGVKHFFTGTLSNGEKNEIAGKTLWKAILYEVKVDTGITCGTVTPSPTLAEEGDTVTLYATPVDGYELRSLKVNHDNSEVTLDGNRFTMPAGSVTVTAVFEKIDGKISYLDLEGKVEECEVYRFATTFSSVLEAGWWVTSGNLINLPDIRLTVDGDVHLILRDGQTLSVPKGIEVTEGNNLTIYAQSTGSDKGALVINGVDDYNAGIGGGYYGDGGTVTISGGKVTATGSYQGAGIGGGYGGNGGMVTISGGTVTATGGEEGAGIGTGTGGGGGTTVKISGGAVTATGGEDGAGIGGGAGGTGGTVTISGGTVIATGGEGGKGISTDSLTLSLAADNDSLTAGSYGGTVTVAEGNAVKYEKDGEKYYFTGTLSDAEKAEIADKTLRKATLYEVKVDPEIIHGTVDVSVSSAWEGQTVTLSVTPDDGYVLTCLTVKKGSSEVTVDGDRFTMPGGNVTVTAVFEEIEKDVPYVDADGRQDHENCRFISENTSELGSGWWVARGGAADPAVNARLVIKGDVRLILRDDQTLTVPKGIEVPEGSSLTIYAQSTGADAGALVIDNVDDNKAGIGSGYKVSGGSVTIIGGELTVTGGSTSAGIGGGYMGSIGTVTISGGAVTAAGGDHGAGIGGGYMGGGGTVTISGGTVTATGGSSAAGIGSVQGGGAVTVTISGGSVTATGGVRGAGIGGGYNGGGGTVTISGGTVSATGGDLAAGIGGGAYGAGSGLTVSGGSVTAIGGDRAAGIGSGCNYSGSDTWGLTLDLGSDDSFLYASGYNGQVAVAEGRRVSDGEGHIYTGTLSEDDKALIAEKYLRNASTRFLVIFDKGDPDASGGMDCVGIRGKDEEYELPACGFIPPEGKLFSGWSVVSGSGEPRSLNAGDKIQITADTTVTAVWGRPTFKTTSLVLSGRIGVNFFMDLPALDDVDYSDSTMTFTITGRGGDMITEEDVYDSSFTNSTGKYYGFTCYVSSVQMADTITATFHYGSGMTEQKTYSVKKYLEDFDGILEADQNAFDQKSIELVRSLADYGHYIQPFLSGYRGWSIGDDFAEMDKYYTEAESYDVNNVLSDIDDYRVETSITGTAVGNMSYSLVLDSETAIYAYFKPADGYSGSLSFRIGEDPVEAALTGGRYLVKIPDIPAHKLGEPCTIKAFAGSNADPDITITLSAMSYVQGLLTSDSYKDDLTAQRAALALYYYFKAADDYKNNTNH